MRARRHLNPFKPALAAALAEFSDGVRALAAIEMLAMGMESPKYPRPPLVSQRIGNSQKYKSSGSIYSRTSLCNEDSEDRRITDLDLSVKTFTSSEPQDRERDDAGVTEKVKAETLHDGFWETAVSGVGATTPRPTPRNDDASTSDAAGCNAKMPTPRPETDSPTRKDAARYSCR
ncbi:hypothetical protein B0H11DRAFT_1914028 [Mycena galericulata]|nr:hypothetical protein B0H11DRAFT_1914015 [Mycena galericulata]KAJ7485033.1 hypothetical protein B0H11DRAFT_1914028 [Mycena galericulata]